MQYSICLCRVSLPADSWVCHVCNFLEPEIQRQLIDHCQTNVKHLELGAYFLLSKFYSSNPMNGGYWIVAFVATTIPSLHVLPSFLYCVEGCPPASKERVGSKIWLVWLMAVIWQNCLSFPGYETWLPVIFPFPHNCMVAPTGKTMPVS